MPTNIGSYIAQLRAEKKISQRELSDRSGISNTEISRIEAGKRNNPTPATLRALSEALNIEYSDLMKVAGYIEEIHETDKFYELVFKDENGEIVDIKRGVKDMFRKDEDWANVAYRVSRELTDEDRSILKDMALSFLKNKKKQ
ncbi:helix-turn-helix domain-containing protein [Dehalobacter sp.]|uniref:helix-turn-helix domain-containing protein n=1 Tax=Dehalobacter sp. TaxID=1962289 RepID=UPI002585495D|nr:helix-turn-helix domain-containing protein [Dehalobacter sp.]MDJ0304749.1 helix-turn-helix domain-containing protein [Dehalobacter sp.]